MATFHIPLGSDRSLGELFSAMPDGPKTVLKEGFSIVSRLQESTHATLVEQTLAIAGRGGGKVQPDLAKKMGLSTREASSAAAATGTLSALLSGRKEGTDEVIQALVSSGLLATSAVPSIQRLVPLLLENKQNFGQLLKEKYFSTAVLPSFDEFEAVLDIRIGDETEVGLAVPVAIAFLDTDANGQRLWFQLTKDDVEEMLRKLNSLLGRFKEAEAIAARIGQKSGGA